MRVTYHIPTEQYGFVEVEKEVDVLNDVVSEYYLLRKTSSTMESLADQKFNNILDKYMATKTLTSEEYEGLTIEQKNIIQCLKRAYKRNEK